MCQEGYGYVYFENMTEDATLKESVTYTRFENLELVKPFKGTPHSDCRDKLLSECASRWEFDCTSATVLPLRLQSEFFIQFNDSLQQCSFEEAGEGARQ